MTDDDVDRGDSHRVPDGWGTYVPPRCSITFSRQNGWVPTVANNAWPGSSTRGIKSPSAVKWHASRVHELSLRAAKV